MDRTEMLAKIKDALVDQLNVDPDAVVESASLINDLGADSLDLLEMVTAVEDEFGVAIPDEDFENIETVEDVLDEVEKLSE